MSRVKKILVAPLEWGLGHATRCMPIIDAILEMGHDVILGGDGRSLQLLRDAYPELLYIPLASYGITYSKNNSQIGAMASQIPQILQAIRKEHQQLEEAIGKMNIDGVISDNRYGLWSKQVPTAFICHQLQIRLPFPFLEPLLYQLHRRFINRFSQCWVPDFRDSQSLSGIMGHPKHLPPNTKYIGPLSRFSNPKQPLQFYSYPELNLRTPDIVAILSGPEPQRSLLESTIEVQARQQDREIWIIQGKPESRKLREEGHLCIIPFMNKHDLGKVIKDAKVIVSRPGYSSLMDFAAFGKKGLILVPTPGQTEQEYLAHRLQSNGIALTQKQKEFSLYVALDESADYQGFITQEDKNTRSSVLEHWISLC